MIRRLWSAFTTWLVGLVKIKPGPWNDDAKPKQREWSVSDPEIR